MKIHQILPDHTFASAGLADDLRNIDVVMMIHSESPRLPAWRKLRYRWFEDSGPAGDFFYVGQTVAIGVRAELLEDAEIRDGLSRCGELLPIWVGEESHYILAPVIPLDLVDRDRSRLSYSLGEPKIDVPFFVSEAPPGVWIFKIPGFSALFTSGDGPDSFARLIRDRKLTGLELKAAENPEPETAESDSGPSEGMQEEIDEILAEMMGAEPYGPEAREPVAEIDPGEETANTLSELQHWWGWRGTFLSIIEADVLGRLWLATNFEGEDTSICIDPATGEHSWDEEAPLGARDTKALAESLHQLLGALRPGECYSLKQFQMLGGSMDDPQNYLICPLSHHVRTGAILHDVRNAWPDDEDIPWNNQPAYDKVFYRVLNRRHPGFIAELERRHAATGRFSG